MTRSAPLWRQAPSPKRDEIQVSQFLGLLREALPSLLPPELRSFQWRQQPALMQVYYWYPAIHYELWLQRQRGIVEVGLHFEGEKEHNHRWAEALAQHMPLIQLSLPRPADLEEWTGWWTRLHYVLPWEPLSPDLAHVYASHLAGFICALQPLMEELKACTLIPPSRVTAPPRRRRRGRPTP